MKTTGALLLLLLGVASGCARRVDAGAAGGRAWRGSSSLEVHFADGDLVFVWPRDGAHGDARVKHLADLVQRTL